MKTDFVASDKTWVVLIEKNPAELLVIDEGQQFTTGQLCDLFDNEADAITRATALGWLPPEENTEEDTPPEEV